MTSISEALQKIDTLGKLNYISYRLLGGQSLLEFVLNQKLIQHSSTAAQFLNKSSKEFIFTFQSRASGLTVSDLIFIISCLSSCTIKQISQLSSHDSIQCIDITFQTEMNDLKSILSSLASPMFDTSFQPRSVHRMHKRLFVFDMDSTLIRQECIDELAREFKVHHLIAPITESAMYFLFDVKVN